MSNSNIDAIFLGKHTDKAVEVCDTLYPEYKDVCTCWVAEAKQAIQQELLKARLDELQKLLFTSQFGVPDGWEATNILVSDIKRCIAKLQASLKDGENQLGEKS